MWSFYPSVVISYHFGRHRVWQCRVPYGRGGGAGRTAAAVRRAVARAVGGRRQMNYATQNHRKHERPE